MRKLKRYQKYNREEIHDIFSPNTKFVPQAGDWGMKGIVSIPNTIDDFIFFVTVGAKQGAHEFEESINELGELTWQSQPSQKLSHPQIKKLINHDEQISTIYLFLRTSRKEKNYTYLGNLAYIEHDNQREMPVYFKWQILEFDVKAVKEAIEGLVICQLEKRDGEGTGPESTIQLNRTDAPIKKEKRREGRKTSDFRAAQIDFDRQRKENDLLGRMGEEQIIKLEKAKLIAAGRRDLAEKVFATRYTIGNNAPYDIISYDETGKEFYIEVKTTEGDIHTPFYISNKEVLYSISFSGCYKLYRIYDFNRKKGMANYYVLEGNLTEILDLEPIQFRAHVEKRNERIQKYWEGFKKSIEKRG